MLRRTVRSIAAVVVVGLLSSLASRVGAQSRGRTTGPDYWVGVSLGYVDGMSMTDNASNSAWNIGSSSQLRATVEKALQGGATLGVSAGFGTASLTYSSGSVFTADCAGGCQANTDITQYLVFVRGGAGALGGARGGGAGIGFHGVYTLEGGITQFGHFREQTTGTKLPPSSASSDFTFGFGGGFGYGMSASSELYVDALSDFVLHKQLTTSSSSAPRVFSFRGGLRIGF